MSKTLNTRIALRCDSTAKWSQNTSAVLFKGEIGIELLADNSAKLKIGDGLKTWSALPYFESGIPVLTGTVAPTTDTTGKLGQIYIETSTNTLYICVAAGNTWKKILTQSDLDTLNTTISDLTSRVGTVETDLDTLESTVSTLSSSFESFKTETTTSLGNKVDKEVGKQLSTEDFTTAEKSKLANLLPVNDETTSTQVVWSAQKIADEIAAKNITLYQGTKTDLDTADGDVITQYFADHSSETPKQGDVFVIKTTVSSKDYELSAYMYNGTSWIALTGFVDADKVILRQDLTLAGSYTQVGNITKSANEMTTYAAKGKSVATLISEIFAKRLQPGTPTQPSVSGFALTGAKAVEAGTPVAEASFGTAKLNPGSYQYGPATGVTATSYSVDRVATPSAMSQTGIATAASGTDDNGGAGFIIGDGSEANAVSSLAYKVTVSYGDGVVANDNMGSPSNPAVKILAGSKTQQTSAYTSFRKYFYGASVNKPTIDSAFIRGLTNSTGAYSAKTFTINVPAGSVRICIACEATETGVTKVVNETAQNLDVTSTFVQSTVDVEGANGYTAKSYKVWTYEPGGPYENAAVLHVTLG